MIVFASMIVPARTIAKASTSGTSRTVTSSPSSANPLVPAHCRMRVYDRDLIRGGHYGQRSCEPHLQAEHMAAPTNAAKREESSCQLGAVHTWHKADLPAPLVNVRC